MDKKHWTSESIEDYKFAILQDFIEQLNYKLENKPESVKYKVFLPKDHKIDEKWILSKDCRLEYLISVVNNMGLKMSIVVHDNDDPENKKGPINSQMFEDCWEALGNPRDWFELEEMQGKEIKLPQRVLDNKKLREANE